jgi:alpha-mannosidase
MIIKTFILSLCVLSIVIASTLALEYQQEQDKPLNVFLVPHSHWDVGWLETVDDYFRDKVKPIIDNVIYLLDGKPDRRFIFAEVAFLERWWSEASPQDRQKFKKLLALNQIEFVQGGWTMPDEALNTYSGIINTMSRGLQWIGDTFGAKHLPKTSWRIDPFGSNTAVSKLYRDMGFVSTVVMRIPHKIESKLRDEKHLEFMYRLNDGTLYFTTVMDIQYCIWVCVTAELTIIYLYCFIGLFLWVFI